MKDVSVGNKNNKFGLKSKLLLGALALAVIVGLATTAQAAQKDTDKEVAFLLLYRQTRFFNPFTLRTGTLSATTNVTRSSSSTGILSSPSAAGISIAPTGEGEGEGGHSRRRLAIRIPFRPALRSPCRPPIIP